jgi:hypothetical protein
MLKEIGIIIICLEDEFQTLLPNFPTLRGSEFFLLLAGLMLEDI